jgi:hypothetical protein
MTVVSAIAVPPIAKNNATNAENELLIERLL